MGWKKIEIEIDTEKLEGALNWFHESILHGLFGGVPDIPDGVSDLGDILSRLESANEANESWCIWRLSAEDITTVAVQEDLVPLSREITEDELFYIAHGFQKAMEFGNEDWDRTLATIIEETLADG